MQLITLRDAWSFCLSVYPEINKAKSEKVYEQLIVEYTRPERAYHNVNHLAQMINSIQEMMNIYRFEDVRISKAIMYLATFFHDYRYITNARYAIDGSNIDGYSNEQASAALASEMLIEMGLTNVYALESIVSLILMTETHQIDLTRNPGEMEQRIFLDADMGILGAEPFKYDDYKEGIREEYSNIDPERYIAGRTNFLHGIRSKKAIFYTEYMNQLYRDQVMDNVNSELKELDKELAELLIETTTKDHHA